MRKRGWTERDRWEGVQTPRADLARTLVAILHDHTGLVWGLAVTGNGDLLASGGADGTVRLWETSTRQAVATLEGHTGAVWGVALSAGGDLLASGGEEGTVRLWAAKSGAFLRALRPEHCYERLDITGLSGITEAQRERLLALGASNQHAPSDEPTARIPQASVR